MSYKQILNPNLDPVVYEDGKLLTDWYGWCLATVETAFGTARLFPTAWAAWEGVPAQYKHQDRNFPVGVYFLIWFSGAGGAGHVAIAFINASGAMSIWTAPWHHYPYFDRYNSIDALAEGYDITYVGWSEYLSDTRIIEPIEAPAAAPAVPVVPAPAKPANILYSRLAQPMNLVVNKDTSWWNLSFADDAHATAAAHLTAGTPFRAFGKAQRTDGDKPAYFMTEEDFGQADVTGVPATNNGVNTVDLSPAPAPVEAVMPLTPAAALPTGGETVSVNVIKPDPDKWQATFTRNLGPVMYVANTNAVIKDIAGLHPDMQLIKGQSVKIGGRFTGPDGNEYLRTTTSMAHNAWYGLPEKFLTLENDIKEESFVDQALMEAGSLKDEAGKALKVAASVDGIFHRVLHRKNK